MDSVEIEPNSSAGGRFEAVWYHRNSGYLRIRDLWKELSRVVLHQLREWATVESLHWVHLQERVQDLRGGRSCGVHSADRLHRQQANSQCSGVRQNASWYFQFNWRGLCDEQKWWETPRRHKGLARKLYCDYLPEIRQGALLHCEAHCSRSWIPHWELRRKEQGWTFSFPQAGLRHLSCDHCVDLRYEEWA